MAESGATAAFDDAVIQAVAADYEVACARLEALLADHQAGVESIPGVENIVYEWRKHFDGTVIERTDRVYRLALPTWVWDEFGDRLDATGEEVDALAAAHVRQVRRSTGEPPPEEGETYMLLVRE